MIAAVLFTWTTQVKAVSVATPTATTNTTKQIEDLKDRLATKVAELRKTERKAMGGNVKSVSISSITIETKTKDIKIELPDDVVVIQYLKGQRTKLTTGDIDKGDSVAVFGTYDATVDIMKASVIIIQNTVTQRISGTIAAMDKTEYTLTVAATDRQSYVVDIETTTKAVTWDQTNGIQKYGFSKMNVGDTIQVLGSPVPKKDNRLSGVRILDLGNLTNPQTSPASTSTITPQATPTPKPTVTATPTP